MLCRKTEADYSRLIDLYFITFFRAAPGELLRMGKEVSSLTTVDVLVIDASKREGNVCEKSHLVEWRLLRFITTIVVAIGNEREESGATGTGAAAVFTVDPHLVFYNFLAPMTIFCFYYMRNADSILTVGIYTYYPNYIYLPMFLGPFWGHCREERKSVK